MESRVKINNEIANLIIKLCFSINDLKKNYQTDDKEELQFFTTYEDLKNKMDDILQASSTRAMSAKIRDAKAFTKNSLKIYKMLPSDFKYGRQTVQNLGAIVHQLTELEKHISNQL